MFWNTKGEVQKFKLLSILFMNYFQLFDGKAIFFGDNDTDDRKIYIGEEVDGVPNGKGNLTYNSGTIYIGSFLNGKPDGYGEMYESGGSIYKGDWRANARNGRGVYVWGEGSWKGDRYEGEFLDGAINGYGKYNFHDGRIYEGQWKKFKQHGEGIFKKSNGDVYIGQFNNDKIQGYGTYTWGEGPWKGNKYIGQWEQSYMDGKGIHYNINGEIYLGEFSAGLFDGLGLKVWPNGKCFHGKMKESTPVYGLLLEFRKTEAIFGRIANDLPHGNGYRFSKLGHKVDCLEWNKGALVQRNSSSCYKKPEQVKTIFYENYDDYEGEVENIDGEEVRQGFGKFVSDRDGRKYTGKWNNNTLNGIGYLHDDLGTSFLGQFRSSLLDGSGVAYSYSQKYHTYYCGGWKKGKMHGAGLFVYPNGDKVISNFSSGKREPGYVYIHVAGERIDW